jgi:hypothetical protein
VSERLDEERLEVLRRWGHGLATDAREELRAAGKAITLLVDEIDRLQVDVWHARTAAASDEPVAGSPQDDVADVTAPELTTTLRDRLGAVLPSLNAKSDT